MSTNQMVIRTIERFKEIAGTDISLYDMEGRVVASTMGDMQRWAEEVKVFAASPAELQVAHGFQFYKVTDGSLPVYIMLMQGGAADSYVYGRLAVLQIQNLLGTYKERFDKADLIKQLLTESILPVDVSRRAAQMRMKTEAARCVYLVEVRGDILTAAQVIRELFADRDDCIVTMVEENRAVIVKQIGAGETAADLEILGAGILEMVNSETLSDGRIGCGTIVPALMDIGRSYKEASAALEVAKIFYAEKRMMSYGNLGVGGLIYELPLPLCRLFIEEVFCGTPSDMIDEETMQTVRRFFDCNLNMSETARQLFIHRNTLSYRLEKVLKMTGLDPRCFEDALTLKTALMVSGYIAYREKHGM